MLHPSRFLPLSILPLLAACHAAEPASGAQSAPASPDAAAVAELPLKRGYYVRVDATCAEASNATIELVRRDGISSCSFTKIESLGAKRYRVHQFCHPREPAEPREYILTGDGSYRIGKDATDEYGQPTEFRFCSQRSLPDPWRDNDISGVSG
ncbi:MAG: hypothetical protein KA124_01405 [Luteimonas sp.]|nr:hypothetical protein [Luteimonas sp.]